MSANELAPLKSFCSAALTMACGSQKPGHALQCRKMPYKVAAPCVIKQIKELPTFSITFSQPGSDQLICY